ncbi:MAG: hypothetical protein SOR79_09345 [Blautia sp.]|uniref:hypothetical protein n=1 Tax=Blautia sp. TaxID=1955243 RepID=UPI002A7547D3|nr:hypothetical protein [Blautia sp.]MDY3017338.1 hypothetical protein [Blautia sp.]
MKNYFGESHKYDDIIHLPHHVSDKRPQMPVLDRAAQFAPFAALTGYGEAVKETARLTERRIQPDEETLDILNRRLEFIKEHISERPEVSVCFFRPDPHKDGGAYVTVSGTVKKLDEFRHRLILTDGTEIPFEDLWEIVFMDTAP